MDGPAVPAKAKLRKWTRTCQEKRKASRSKPDSTLMLGKPQDGEWPDASESRSEDE